MAEPLPYPTEDCRSCHAVVRWAVDSGGDRLLLDVPALPVLGGAELDPRNGDVVLTERPGFLPLARVVTNAAVLFSKTTVWRRHIVTCPHADYWRTRAKHAAGRSTRRAGRTR